MERRCILSGETGNAAHMIRLAIGPDDQIIPDLGGKLPGRGLWICADAILVEDALKKGRFRGAVAKATKGAIGAAHASPELPLLLDRLMVERLLGRLGMEMKAGRLVTGFEKVAARLKSGRVRVLIEAADAAADGRRKIESLPLNDVIKIALFDRMQLGLALGRENVVHAAIEPGTAAEKIIADHSRLARWRGLDKVASGPNKARAI